MTLDFIRFKASDNVELQGWLSNEKSDLAVIHIHGMSGNGYENYFLDSLREMYHANNISFFTIDTRGRGVISSFWQGGSSDSWGEGTKLGGSCFEIFEESVADIRGAINYLKSIGKNKFILQGHSLGASKVVNYLMNGSTEVVAAILLAPTDMVGWANTDPNHKKYLKRANELIAENKKEELVGAQCWLDKTPLSAQTYQSISEEGSAIDIYRDIVLGKINVPALIVYGDNDIGITEIDGTIEKWQSRVEKIKNKNTIIFTIREAAHGFKGFEKELSKIVVKFIQANNAR